MIQTETWFDVKDSGLIFDFYFISFSNTSLQRSGGPTGNFPLERRSLLLLDQILQLIPKFQTSRRFLCDSSSSSCDVQSVGCNKFFRTFLFLQSHSLLSSSSSSSSSCNYPQTWRRRTQPRLVSHVSSVDAGRKTSWGRDPRNLVLRFYTSWNIFGGKSNTVDVIFYILL